MIKGFFYLFLQGFIYKYSRTKQNISGIILMHIYSWIHYTQILIELSKEIKNVFT